MSHTTTDLSIAIERSSSHNEIVTVIVADIGATFAALTSDIETEYDYVDTRDADGNPLREVWDTEDQSDSGDMEWRVHLVQRKSKGDV